MRLTAKAALAALAINLMVGMPVASADGEETAAASYAYDSHGKGNGVGHDVRGEGNDGQGRGNGYGYGHTGKPGSDGEGMSSGGANVYPGPEFRFALPALLGLAGLIAWLRRR